MSIKTMRAVQLKATGPASNLVFVELPLPVPEQGQVLIRVKSFGLNRADLVIRKLGRAPAGPVPLPLVLGFEVAGEVEAAPGHENRFPKGAAVIAAMGGMGLAFDGGYAEYTCVPLECVQPVRHGVVDKLGWEVLGALPVMLQTAHGSLLRSLKLKRGDKLLIRGCTSSIGLAAAAIAKRAGATVIGTTRRSAAHTAQMLKDNGCDHVIVDDALLAAVTKISPNGVDKVLELVGGPGLAASLSCLSKDGICCITGFVGGQPQVTEFNPFAMIRTERYLTAYAERKFALDHAPMHDLIDQISAGELKLRLGKVFSIEQIVEAHEYMEANKSLGKIVVLTGM